jgi:hypothetical protein
MQLSGFSRKQKAAFIASITTVLTAFAGAATLWAQSVHSDVSAVPALGSRMDKVEQRTADMEKRLDRFEDKLDKILFELKRR